MPRTNNRARGPEADVAARIAMEREHRGLSAAGLARLMTDRGCPINQSAINKIEQGDPPRRITVDELVAFAQIFGLEIDDLLTPAHAARDREVELAYRGLAEAASEIEVLMAVCSLQLERLARLTPVDAIVSHQIKESAQNFRTASEALEAAVASVSDEVRERLRARPPTIFPRPPAKPLKRDLEQRARERRAAKAASPPVVPVNDRAPVGNRRPATS